MAAAIKSQETLVHIFGARREAAALAVPLPAVQLAELPRPLLPDVGRRACPARDPRDPLQRPNAPAAQSPALPGAVRVAALDRRDRVRAPARLCGLRVRL